MLKANATVTGTILRSAEVKQTQGGGRFVSFPMVVTIPGGKGQPAKQVEVRVGCDGGDAEAALFYAGLRVTLTGTLSFRKRGDDLYLTLRASRTQSQACLGSAEAQPQAGEANFRLDTTDGKFGTDEPDSIAATCQFRGGVGKQVEEKTDKKGKPYLMFSAFSAEKVGEGFEYVWVRFLGFDMARPDWLQPKVRVEATGQLDITVYNDRVSLTCRLSEIKQYVKPDTYGQ